MRLTISPKAASRSAAPAVRAAAAAAALALAAAACSDSGETPGAGTSGTGKSGGSAVPPAHGVLASQTLMQSPQAKVEVLSLDRVSGQVVIARMRVTNSSGAELNFGTTLAKTSLDDRDIGKNDPNSVSAIELFDGANSKLHSPLIAADQKCLCSRLSPALVQPGQAVELQAAYPAPPAGVDRVGLIFPGAVPILDLPLGNRSGGSVTVAEGVTLDATATKTLTPRIVPVIATVESDSGAEDDTGANLSVRISADVLFAINKADLTPRAREILAEVARKIDQSPGNTVQIDGHTDNTGNDAINAPLSERRAKSVENALRQLVTRQGVTYQSRGHGSSQPLRSNDTVKGRQANRRVAVTFAKPKPAPAGPAAPAPSGAGAPSAGARIQPSPFSGWAGPWPRKAEVKVAALHRGINGYAALVFTVTNEDSEIFDTNAMFKAAPGEGYYGAGTDGVVLVAGGKRYRALRDDRGLGLGPRFDTMDVNMRQLEQGEQLRFTAMFKLPPDLTSVAVQIPGFQRIGSLAVS